jgi:hypothetical protein
MKQDVDAVYTWVDGSGAASSAGALGTLTSDFFTAPSVTIKR